MGTTDIICAIILVVAFVASCFVIAKISAWITARDEAYEREIAKDKTAEERIKSWRDLTFTPEKRKVSPMRFAAAVIFGAAGGFLLGNRIDDTVKLIFMMALFVILFMIAFIDQDTMEIPPYLNYTILAMGIAAIWLIKDVTLVERLIGMVCTSVPLLLINLVIQDAFGMGDIKLMFAAGFLLGWKVILVGFIFGIFVGGVLGVVVLIRKSKTGKDHMPFGPALCIGIAIAVLYAEPILKWYTDLLKFKS